LVLDLRLLGVLSTNMELAGNSSMNCTSRRKKLYNVRWKWRKRNWRLRWNMLVMNMKLRFFGNVSFIELEFLNISFDIYCIDLCIGSWIFRKIVLWFAIQFLLAFHLTIFHYSVDVKHGWTLPYVIYHLCFVLLPAELLVYWSDVICLRVRVICGISCW